MHIPKMMLHQQLLRTLYATLSLTNSTLLTPDTILWCTKILFPIGDLPFLSMEEISSLRAPFVPFNSLFTNKIYLLFLFSNFVWMFPARKATTRVTIKTLKERIVSNISVTGILVSVNAQCFTSREFRHLFCYLRIRHVTISYYPQASNWTL